MDIQLMGGTFTWSNNCECPSWSRIDRFLLTSDWELHYLDLIQRRLPKLCSNYFPILLDYGGIQVDARYFKFSDILRTTQLLIYYLHI